LDSLPSPDWYRAFTLEERSRIGPPAASGMRGELGPLRLARWKRQSPFDQDDWFARRLALDGLTEEELLRFLDESPESLRERSEETPSWFVELESAFASPPASTASPPSADSPDEAASRAFLDMILPLSEHACKRLEEAARELAREGGAPFDPAHVVRLLWPAVEGLLLAMLGRTLVLELHVARVQGDLHGNAPEDRFESFARRLRDPGVALGLLREYPVLARQIVTCLDRWVEASRELLERLQADLPAIREAFSPAQDPGRVISLDGGAGDLHRGGRSVVIATFASGLRLVYKPRPLAVDIHFQELLGWLERRSGLPRFRTLAVLDRGGYGWVEFVEAGPCSTEEEIRRFHLRLGGLLALLYVLEATDFHFENLIAAGEHPVPIDLECLFHPRISIPGNEQPDLRVISPIVSRSVLRVGLLPFRIGEGEDREGVDISGLAAVEGEMSPNPVPQWDRPATDEMVAVRRRVPLSGASNRPRLGGREVDAVEHVESFVEGFTAMYRALARHREEIAELLDRFAGDPVRAVLRATRGYHRIWYESFHPDMLRDALDRDFLLDRLWVGVEDHPHLLRVLPHERRDLLDGDVPAFGSRPDSADLWTSLGERLPDFFEEPALAAVRRKLERLGREDLKLQTWLVRSSVSTLVFKREVIPWPRYERVEPPGEIILEDLRERLLAQARAAGDRLEELAFRSEEGASWIGFDFHQNRWSLIPLPEDLYAGTPGILLFLAELGRMTGEARFTGLARDTLRALLGRLPHTAPAIGFIGAFQGWGGILYALTRTGALWGDQDLLDQAESLLDRLPPLIEADRTLDVVAGAAGCLAALLAFRRTTGSVRALELARLCGEHLLVRAEPAGFGIGWRTQIESDQPPTGFSHGAAGIGWALWKLAEEIGDERLLDTARGAFRYEQERYEAASRQPPHGGDPEVRRPRTEAEQATVMAWCYGPPGVALARLGATGSEPCFRQDLETTVRDILDRGFGYNHSLCHGALGNLDILLQIERALALPWLQKEIAHQAWNVLDSMDHHGFLCGTPVGIESPGLMNGLAGIGYGLLRLAEPGRVPSVLGLGEG
jgi:type 2 lantibiotic biosynthesis protein LanM